MASSGGGSQLPAPATHSNLLPFIFPSVGLEVVKHSFQRQAGSIKLRGKDWEAMRLGLWLSNSSKLAVCLMSACIERDSIVHDVHDLQCSQKLRAQFLGS